MSWLAFDTDRSNGQPAAALPGHRSSIVARSSESQREKPPGQRIGALVAAPREFERLAAGLAARPPAQWTRAQVGGGVLALVVGRRQRLP
eukprot:6038350-Pyramimonas_sp.AAC.1